MTRRAEPQLQSPVVSNSRNVRTGVAPLGRVALFVAAAAAVVALGSCSSVSDSDPVGADSVTAAAPLSPDSSATSDTQPSDGSASIPEPTTASATATPSTPATPEPTATPTATATPEPTATPTATPTPVDTTPVVMQGDGWAITEADVARLADFVETTHELDFTDTVDVLVSTDIGAEYGQEYEAFDAGEWYLLQGLGLVDRATERTVINQARRDRIRGLCCRIDDETDRLAIIVEVEDTKLEAETIVVHELTHALHRQHPELFDWARYETDETPRPYAVSIEGVPQFVAFQYFAAAADDQRAEAERELPIIRDDMVSLVGEVAALHLNFAYGVGPTFVDHVVAERGTDGLFDLLAEPPETTEQILFPEKYLAGETATPVPVPAVPDGATLRASGTIGAVVLSYVLERVEDPESARRLVANWQGDSYIVFESGDRLCLTADIVLDGSTPAFTAVLDQALRPESANLVTTATGNQILIETCGPA